MTYQPRNPNGQATMANSEPVVIASNQTAVPVTLSSLPTLPAGANNIGDVDVLTLPALPTGANVIGSIAQITTSITPGTAAANLGKAEDAVHSSGDTGVFVLGVSATTAAAFGASGDYTPFSLDTFGRLRVVGAVAHDAVAAGDVILVGGRASQAAPTAVSADLDGVWQWMDRLGRSVVTQKCGTSSLGNVTASITSTTLALGNTARLGMTVYNDSSSVCYVKLGATASATDYTVKMQPGDYYELPYGYYGQVDAIWVSATGTARVTQLS